MSNTQDYGIDSSLKKEQISDSYKDIGEILIKKGHYKCPIDGSVVTFIDMPINISFDEDQYENYSKTRDWIAKKIGINLESAESRRYIQEVLEESISFLERTLNVSVLKNIKGEISKINLSRKNITNFIIKSQKISKNNTSGIIVCAILKVAEIIHYVRQNPSLQNLEQKTRRFGDWFLEKMNVNITDIEVLKKILENEGAKIPISYQGGAFLLKEFMLKTKDNDRIIGKLLRKPETDASKIVRDGIRGRMVVAEKEKENALDWLKKLGFKEKTTKTPTTFSAEGKIKYMIGEFEGTEVELQISDENSFKTWEGGVYKHEVFQTIQNMLILCRLFGSISERRFKNEIQKLYQSEKISKEKLTDHFKKYFFKDWESERWYSYEYEFRIREKNIFKEERFKRMLLSFIRDFAKSKEWEDLEDLSSNTLQEIFEKKFFRDEIRMETRELFIKFLKTKKGVPEGLLKILKESANIQKKVKSNLAENKKVQ